MTTLTAAAPGLHRLRWALTDIRVLTWRTLARIAMTLVAATVTAAADLVVGWRIHTGPAGVLLALGLATLFAYASAWEGACVGMLARGAESAQAVGLTIIVPLSLTSNAFISTARLTPWLRDIANWNPIRSRCGCTSGGPGIDQESIDPDARGRPGGTVMRIMVVTDQYAPMVGGVPTVTRTLARGLAQRGHAVALLAPSPGWRGRLDAEEQVSVHYRGSVPWPWYEGMRLACVPACATRGVITAFAPDMIHVHSPVTLGVMARIGARRLRIPVVCTNHYLPVNVRPSLQQRPRVSDALFYSYVVGFSNRCSHVTAPTATALRLLRAQGLRVPSGVISNGVDLRTYSPGPADERIRDRYGLPGGRPLILSVGRLSPEKRVDVLLDAAARLTGDAQVAIAGTGPEEAALRARSQRLGLAGRVRFLGFVPGPDLPALYRLADVFAIASEAELQSLTTMEAMATGLPVVAADACALGELVSHGHNGFLAAPGQAGEMAAYLDALICDPDRRGAMAAASLRIISGHEHRRGLAEWESLYGPLAAAGSGERLR